MSIRRKQRQRGKRKELRRKALITWARLAHIEPLAVDRVPFMNASVIMPIIRTIMPNTIAQDLVGIQPKAIPVGMFGDVSSGVEPTFKYRYNHDKSKKEIQEQRKKERKAKKRKRGYVDKALREKAKQVRED